MYQKLIYGLERDLGLSGLSRVRNTGCQLYICLRLSCHSGLQGCLGCLYTARFGGSSPSGCLLESLLLLGERHLDLGLSGSISLKLGPPGRLFGECPSGTLSLGLLLLLEQYLLLVADLDVLDGHSLDDTLQVTVVYDIHGVSFD